MITEDYCSYEVAKLLKEKGFEGDINAYYHIWDYGNKVCSVQEFSRSEAPHLYIPAPTHQMAMKWLRETHDIIVVVEPHMYDYINSKTSSYVFCLWYGDNYEEPYSNQHSNIRGMTYNSYEEAVEAALKYCLENLI